MKLIDISVLSAHEQMQEHYFTNLYCTICQQTQAMEAFLMESFYINVCFFSIGHTNAFNSNLG